MLCEMHAFVNAGSPRVEGDEEEEDVDDLENEFNFDYENEKQNGQHIAEAMLHGQMSYGRGDDHDMPHMTHTMLPQVPLLTNGPMVSTPSSVSPFFSSNLSKFAIDEAYAFTCVI